MIFRKNKNDKDYKPSHLPKNRIDSFKDILSLQFMTLFKLGLMLLLFGVPLIIHQIILNISLYEIELAYSLGNISKPYAEQAISDTFNMGHLIRIPLLMLFGVGLSGALRILRQLIFQEPLFFFDDFKKGIKSHLFYVELSLFLVGSSYTVFHMVMRRGYFIEDDILLSIAGVLSIVVLLTVILISHYVIVQTTLYDLKIGAIYKNALLFMLHFFFPTFGLIILIFCPWFILFIPLGSFFIFVFALLFISLPFGILLLLEYTYDIFDRTINLVHYKSIYKKGLYYE